MKYFLILNPGAKDGSSGKKFKKIFRLLNEKKIEYDYKITKNLEGAYSLSVESNKIGYDAIIAVGGDGTINRVLNGFYNNQGKRISSSKLGVIYTGTSPDFCKSYNIPVNLADALRLILQGKGLKIQIGQITFAGNFDRELDGKLLNEDVEIMTRYFGCCANFGIGPLLAQRANSGTRRIFGDFLGTFFALISTLVSYRPNDFTVIRDENLETLEKVFNLSVGKTFYIASGIKIKSDLIEGDSRFYNLLVKNMRLKNWASVLRKIYSGKQIISDKIISLTYCKSVEICGNNLHPEVEFDGDTIGFLPCKIEMAEDKLDLICEPL